MSTAPADAAVLSEGVTAREREPFPWLFVLLGWIAIAIVFVVRSRLELASLPLISDTDDAMRLTVVHDLLGGQNWFDHIQHRLNTPYGAEIHWSRLVDVPIAALMLLVGPFAGAQTDTIVAYLWPLMLLLALIICSSLVSLRLAGRAGVLPAIVLPALSPALLAEFDPGRMDHHSVQIVLALALLWCCMEARRRNGFALWAGFIASTSLAIGTEALPTVVAAVLAFGMLWVFIPGRAIAMRGFGVAFALTAAVHLALALPPGRWFEPACDALSIVYVLAAIGVGLAFLVLSILPLASRPLWMRLLAGLACAALVTGTIAALFPQCLRGPYAAVDPWLVRNWLSYISEAKPIWESFKNIPPYVVAVAVPPALALLVVAVRVVRHRVDRAEWLIYGVFLLIAAVIMVLQIRGARFTAALAVPAGAYLIVTARAAYLAHRRPLPVLALVLSWISYAGIVVSLATNAAISGLPAWGQFAGSGGADQAPCLMPASFEALAALPPQRLMTPIDLGAHMLLYTPHAVVAAPYHRNQQGVRAAFDFFNTSIGSARQILDERGVTLVVVCPTMPEMRGFADAAGDSFIRLSGRGQLPAWLVDQTPPGSPFKVYKVLPQ